MDIEKVPAKATESRLTVARVVGGLIGWVATIAVLAAVLAVLAGFVSFGWQVGASLAGAVL